MVVWLGCQESLRGIDMNWNDYLNFSKTEFDCKHTGENRMRPEFLEVLQQIRTTLGRPMVISSGYRSPSHPVEAAKDKAGEHTYGVAADIKGDRLFLLDLIVVAYGYGIRRIGINFDQGFVHLGIGDRELNFPSVPWTY